jgi:hypothetical protein
VQLQQQNTQLGGASAYGQGNYGQGVYGESANNSVVISPTPGDVWSVDYVETQTTSQSIPFFAVYLNHLDPTGLLGMSIDANLDEVEFPEMRMTSTDVIICIWYGGDAGAQAWATAYGGIFEPE